MLCQNFLEHLLPATFAQDLKTAVGKAALMAETVQLPEHVCSASIKGKIDYTPYDEVLRILMAAQVQLQAVEINYCSRLNAAGSKSLLCSRSPAVLSRWAVHSWMECKRQGNC